MVELYLNRRPGWGNSSNMKWIRVPSNSRRATHALWTADSFRLGVNASRQMSAHEIVNMEHQLDMLSALYCYRESKTSDDEMIITLIKLMLRDNMG